MNHKILMRLMLVIGLSLASFVLEARPLKVILKVASIKAHQTQEKGGDEIYFSLTQYSNKHKRPKQMRVPIFPTHWLSKQLPSIHDQSLWEAILDSEEVVQLVISLTEHDAPPWNVDDHIASVKLTLANYNEKLALVWAKPDLHEQGKVIHLKEAQATTFILKGNASEYEIRFELEAR